MTIHLDQPTGLIPHSAKHQTKLSWNFKKFLQYQVLLGDNLATWDIVSRLRRKVFLLCDSEDRSPLPKPVTTRPSSSLYFQACSQSCRLPVLESSPRASCVWFVSSLNLLRRTASSHFLHLLSHAHSLVKPNRSHYESPDMHVCWTTLWRCCYSSKVFNLLRTTHR